MRLHTLAATTLFCFFSLTAFAAETSTKNANRIAIQAAMATGGLLGIGVVDYTEKTEIGLTASGSINNASSATKTVTPVIFGGFRKSLLEQTYFAYGLDFAATFGKEDGARIQSDYAIGPYISLEQMMTYHLMLAGWIQPYQYRYKKLSGASSTSTNSFFSTGGIAFNYLF